MNRLSILALLVLLGSASVSGAKDSPSVNNALSASFLPLRLHVANPVLRARLTVFLQTLPQDSTAWAVWEGEDLNISMDLAVRLGAFSDTAGEFRTRTRRVLERVSGSGIEEGGGLFANAYYPDDSLFDFPQWALYNRGGVINGLQGKAGVDLGMTRVWEKFDGDDSLVIADIDAGINFLHPDLRDRWYRNMAEVNGTSGVDDDRNGFIDDTASWDFVDNDNYPQDYHGHGTLISGLMVANFDNTLGLTGMIPRGRVLPVRVLNSAGLGSLTNIAAGIQYAVRMKVSAINFSISGGWAGTNTALRAAFQAARDSGIPIIVATGNDARNLDSLPMTPSSYGFDNIYMTASHSNSGPLVSTSNYGRNTVPIAAPGGEIISTHIPAYITVFSDNFEAGISNWSFAAAGNFVASTTAPLQGAQTLQWSTGVNTWAATTNFIDLTGRVGSTVKFNLDYRRASASDGLIVEGQREGSTVWTAFASIASTVANQTLSFDLHPMEGARFKLRFRTLASGAVTMRVLRVDDVNVYCYDPTPQKQGAYQLSGGTSLAAPYMTGYIGMLRLACRRMNNTPPFTRTLALAAATPESSLTGKVSTGGRLDVAKGLDFYLRTLPGLALTDSTKVSWTLGDTVKYSLSVPGAPATAYVFRHKTKLTGSTLSTSGQFAFNSTGAAAALDTVRFRAEGNPLVLRRFTTFTLIPKPVGIPGMASSFSSEALLWVGGRAFALPQSFHKNSRHTVYIESIEANGRSHPVFSGEVTMPSGTGKISYQVPGLMGIGWKVKVDGADLPPRFPK